MSYENLYGDKVVLQDLRGPQGTLAFVVSFFDKSTFKCNIILVQDEYHYLGSLGACSLEAHRRQLGG